MDFISPTHIILILVAALIIFGPKRLPDIGKSLGKGIKEFKGALIHPEEDETPAPPPTPVPAPLLAPAIPTVPAQMAEAPATPPATPAATTVNVAGDSPTLVDNTLPGVPVQPSQVPPPHQQ